MEKDHKSKSRKHGGIADDGVEIVNLAYTEKEIELMVGG